MRRWCTRRSSPSPTRTTSSPWRSRAGWLTCMCSSGRGWTTSWPWCARALRWSCSRPRWPSTQTRCWTSWTRCAAGVCVVCVGRVFSGRGEGRWGGGGVHTQRREAGAATSPPVATRRARPGAIRRSRTHARATACTLAPRAAHTQSGLVRWRLFRESCCPYEGYYVKDLTCLGRDLAHTIIVDNSPHSYVFQPENAGEGGGMGGGGFGCVRGAPGVCLVCACSATRGRPCASCGSAPVRLTLTRTMTHARCAHHCHNITHDTHMHTPHHNTTHSAHQHVHR
jgi:hypothetical protein